MSVAEPFVISFVKVLHATSGSDKVWRRLGSYSETAMVDIVTVSCPSRAAVNILEEYKRLFDVVNNNPEQAGEWVAEHEIIADANLAAKAIPNCNIVLIHGQEMVGVLEPLFAILHQANPKSVGGSIPDQDFYYIP